MLGRRREESSEEYYVGEVIFRNSNATYSTANVVHYYVSFFNYFVITEVKFQDFWTNSKKHDTVKQRTLNYNEQICTSDLAN
jgi:hypothetical protein